MWSAVQQWLIGLLGSTVDIKMWKLTLLLKSLLNFLIQVPPNDIRLRVAAKKGNAKLSSLHYSSESNAHSRLQHHLFHSASNALYIHTYIFNSITWNCLSAHEVLNFNQMPSIWTLAIQLWVRELLKRNVRGKGVYEKDGGLRCFTRNICTRIKWEKNENFLFHFEAHFNALSSRSDLFLCAQCLHNILKFFGE